MSQQAVTVSTTYGSSLSRLFVIKSCKTVYAARQDRHLSYAVESSLDFSKDKMVCVPNNPHFLDLAFINFFSTEKKFVTREKYLLCIHYFDKKPSKTTNRIKGIVFLRLVIK